MNKLTRYSTAGIIALSILPFAASAHGTEANSHKGFGAEIRSLVSAHFNHDKDHEGDKMKAHAYAGTVTAVGTSSFTLTTANGKVYTVNTANAKITQPFSKTAIALSAIKVNDKVVVKGALTDTTIAAKSVVDMPANTHPAMTTGSVTAVSGNTITVQNTHTGVVSNVTVNTSANTQVTKDGQAATAADVTVGSKISVKGLWDETLNVLNAIKINIRTALSK